MEPTFQKSMASLNTGLIDNYKSALGFGLSVMSLCFFVGNSIVDRYPIKQPMKRVIFFQYCKGRPTCMFLIFINNDKVD